MNRCRQEQDDDWDVMAPLSVIHRCGYKWQLRPGRQNVLRALCQYRRARCRVKVRPTRGSIHPQDPVVACTSNAIWDRIPSVDSIAGPRVERRTDFRCPRNDVYATIKK
jgi:hypothetical protein